MPLFGDQHDNLARAIRRGQAVSLDQSQVQSKQALEAAFKEALSTEFQENAQRTKTAIRAHATPALDKVAAWVNYGIATQGAKHRIPLWISEQFTYLDFALPHFSLGASVVALLSLVFLLMRCIVGRMLAAKEGSKKKWN